MNLASICWQNWQPQDHVSLVCLQRSDHILLMHKLRGFGASKVVLPGGRKHENESLADCAIREFQEEVGLTPHNPHHLGCLRYQFRDGFKLQIEVFSAQSYHGTLCNSDEARPFWQTVQTIPYAQMWPDTQHWLPLVLDRQHFRGRFLFEQNQMLEMDLVTNANN